MNKKEALETILKVRSVCDSNKECITCPYLGEGNCMLTDIVEDYFVEEITKELRELDKYEPNDNVNSPAHYCKGGIECIEALKAATVGLTGMEAVCTANVIKYLWRWKFKNGVEDLKKACWYINHLIKELEEGNNVNY